MVLCLEVSESERGCTRLLNTSETCNMKQSFQLEDYQDASRHKKDSLLCK